MEKILIRKGQYRVKFYCDYCGDERTERESHYLRSKRHFCNAQCYADYCRFDLPAEEHNHYGAGFPKEERQRRAQCRSILNHAIRDGKINRQSCEIRGCEGLPEAHHDDYNEPLNVRWLCFKHHREHHRTIWENPELLEGK